MITIQLRKLDFGDFEESRSKSGLRFDALETDFIQIWYDDRHDLLNILMPVWR